MNKDKDKDLFVAINDVQFLDRNIIKTYDKGPIEEHKYKYTLKLPTQFLHEWDVYDYWEKERIESMEKNLTKDDVMLYIGAEHGWMPALYAKYMLDPSKVVLFEPAPDYWPNIKAIWKANGLADPMDCYAGLASNKTKEADEPNFETGNAEDGWPLCSNSEYLMKKLSYRYIHEHSNNTPQITIDDYVNKAGISPTSLSMDVEGGEILIIEGAEQTLRNNKMLCWISVHPDMMERNYSKTGDDFHKLMQSFGYKKKLLAIDHEEHWLYWNGDEPK